VKQQSPAPPVHYHAPRGMLAAVTLLTRLIDWYRVGRLTGAPAE